MGIDDTASAAALPGAGHLDLLITSPRVGVGLLTRAAWRALESADLVCCVDPEDPTVAPLLTDAGVPASRPEVASVPQLAAWLVARAVGAHVLWIGSPDGDPGLTDALAAELTRVAATSAPPTVEVLIGSYDVPGARLLDLVAVMDRLRSPGGCPWDAEQTHTSLVPYLLEEAYEAADAVEAGDRTHMREELGDVLLQVVFHARVGQEHRTDPFDVDDVAAGIVAKLVRRHPHVFSSDAPRDEPTDPERVQQRWDDLKDAERGSASPLDGIPAALPALARAQKVLGRMERLRRHGRLATDVLERSTGDQLGDALLDLVRQARRQGVDAESALRQAVRTLERRAAGPVETSGAPTPDDRASARPA
ncbi:MAG: MazG family protein [Angustibacter sp.]